MLCRAVVLGLVLPALVAPVATEARTSKQPILDRAGSPDDDASFPTLALARFTSIFDVQIVPQSMVDSLVRWQVGLRDVVRGTANRLAELAQATGFRTPDLTTLTTFPLPRSDDSWATSGFGWRDDPMRHRAKFHSGADIRAKPGTPVFAAGDGVVIFAGRQGGYGNLVTVDHGGGVITRYAHLRRIHTVKGDSITAGKRIGQVGSTGRTTGPHLHFEVRLDGNPVCPTTALTVGKLQREAPEEAKLAAFALAPEMQTHQTSALDPPKARKARKAKSNESRPDRPGRVKHVRPVS
jgi:murein DD-endopeptidase MepM/ murein hydrolase activator NlpD